MPIRLRTAAALMASLMGLAPLAAPSAHAVARAEPGAGPRGPAARLAGYIETDAPSENPRHNPGGAISAGALPRTDLRRGCPPALSFSDDRSCLTSGLWHDAGELVTRRNGITLLLGSGASWLVHDRLDDDIAESTARHPRRWGDIQELFDAAGNPLAHFSLAAGLYAYSLMEDDAEVHDLSKTLVSVVVLNGVATGVLKQIARTERPNGDPRGWPSGHVSSSVAVAAVLDEYYGHRLGVPAYVFAGLVGWERIDDREHDLSDVLFGAVLGYVIGKTIASDHHGSFCGMELIPCLDPATGSMGLFLAKLF